jgi:hypothetical protein
VRVVPALEDVNVQIDGRTYRSDEHGVINIPLSAPGTYPITVLPWVSPDGNKKAEFRKWSDDVRAATRTIEVHSGSKLDIGFDVSYLVGVRYVAPDGQPVDSSRVTSTVLHSSIGTQYVFTDNMKQWLQHGYLYRQPEGLGERSISYSVDSVIVSGSNVVNRNQQRFPPEAGLTLPIKLLLFSMSISSEDALFGSPVGDAVLLKYPDGHIERVALDSSGSATLSGLARGDYSLGVEAGGIAFERPVSLSRDQAVAVQVISYADIGVVVGSLGLIVLGLLVAGRPRLIRHVALPARLGGLRGGGAWGLRFRMPEHRLPRFTVGEHTLQVDSEPMATDLPALQVGSHSGFHAPKRRLYTAPDRLAVRPPFRSRRRRRSR